MNNKKNKFFSRFPSLSKSILKLFRSRSISTQLILTIILIFATFFTLQTLLNSQFFKNYYTEREFNDIHADLMEYVDKMNDPSRDIYDEMYVFTSQRNAYSVVVNSQFRIFTSSYTNYTIVVEDISSLDQYTVIIPDNNYTYTIDELISLTIYPYNELNEDLYSPSLINVSEGTIYSSNLSCSSSDCVTLSGKIIQINKPNNLNYVFENNTIVKQEISKLSSEFINLSEIQYMDNGYWYKSTDGPIDTLVFIHDLRNWDYIITIIPIEDTDEIISIVSSYNNYVYLTAIVIIFLWSFRLSSIISKPIQNIELVTKEIANLNFNAEAHEYKNKESASLSRSINLISRNLKEALETLNTKNQELTTLYNDQSMQVSLKKQLVSSISHELKTPLMIMQVTIQGILDGVIPQEDQKTELLNVVDEINKSSAMIQDMLQIYRLDDANSELEITEFNLSDSIKFFIQDFENIIKSYNFNLEVNIPDKVIIEADKKLINRVISNYFTNAIKYTNEGERIYLEVYEDEDRAYFELTNYGVTIKEEELENIWTPFYRANNKTETPKLKTKGTGIGLYLVSEILKAHNSEFGIHNVENGVKAYFYINKKVE